MINSVTYTKNHIKAKLKIRQLDNVDVDIKTRSAQLFLFIKLLILITNFK
jgi:hypothetical protein